MISSNCEKCASCKKAVRTGHPFVTCKNCDCILHKKCKSNANMKHFRGDNFCTTCLENRDIVRYNPLYQPPHLSTDEVFDDEPVDYIQSLDHISQTLENCATYSISQFQSLISSPPPPDKMHLSSFFLNIDGNSSNFDNLAVELLALKHSFSFIALAETNTDSCNENLYQLNKYSSCYQDRVFLESKTEFKSKGTGVCLYVHNSLNFSKDTKLSMCKESIESLFVTITNLSEPLLVGVIYRPPSAQLDDFNAEYKEILSQLSDKKAYIMGDFNVNLLKLDSAPETEFEEIVFTSGFAPVISLPTHQMPHCSKTSIDNIHTNDIDSSIVSGVLASKISHHSPIFFIKELLVESRPAKPAAEKITIHYDYSNANLDKLCSIIENSRDQFLNDCNSFESFLLLFQNKIDEACKLATPKTTKRNSITNPWITAGLVNSVQKKARLYSEWSKTKSLSKPEGDSDKYAAYSDFRRNLKSIIKAAKNLYYIKKFEQTGRNSKKTWGIINELRGKAKSQLKDDFVIDGDRVRSRRAIANKFNQYFTSLAHNLNEQVLANMSGGVQILPFDTFAQFMNKSVPKSIYLEDTNEVEITEIIGGFQNNKASDIPICVLKKTSHLIAGPISKLYNECMKLGTFPSPFKIGKVTPIYKKGNRECIENYRPVSILPIFGKIFEKIIYNRLYTFLTSNGVLHDEQFGFRKGHSTTHALHRSVHNISKSLSNNMHVLGIFIDLSKAFDTLDHGILLKKVENYGIRGNALSLLKSYLQHRTQYVKFLDSNSESLEIRYGVPQGSILGPLLFLLYVNDIVNCYKGQDCKIVLYADDTNIFVSGPSKEITFLKANEILEHVSQFMKSNLLHVNMGKCCFIHFQPKVTNYESCARARPIPTADDRSQEIFVNNTRILKVTHAKFLGVIIDENLNWVPHIENLRKKLRSTTGAICRIRRAIPLEHYRNIYTALFESHMCYGISVWGSTLKERPEEKLFTTQKHCMRVLFGDLAAYLDKHATCARVRPFGNQKLGAEFYTKEHTKPIFNKTKILTIQNLYKYHCILEMYKIIKFRTPYSLFEDTTISMRDSSHAIILPPKSNYFLYKASSFWNSTCKKLIEYEHGFATSVSLVKARLKNLLLQIQSLHQPATWNNDNFNILCITLLTSFDPSPTIATVTRPNRIDILSE